MADETPVTWGATVQDVKDLLPHVFRTTGTETSNPRYALGTTAPIPDEQVQRFIERSAARVNARLPEAEGLSPVARAELTHLARDLVSTGAAHLVQTSLYPGSSDPNDGDAYATQLWERMKVLTDDAQALAADEVSGGAGAVTFSFPPSSFPDWWQG